MKRHGYLCSILLLLFLSVLIINAGTRLVNSESVHETEVITINLSYTPSDPILIQSDADFETQGWSGNGTQDDPYMISGLSITADDVDCIKISDTTVFFKITDCLVSRVTWPHDPVVFSGINLFNVSNCVIDEISATHKLEGIFIEKSINCTITNSQLYDNEWYGCEIRNSTLCYVTNCTFTDNGSAGLVARWDIRDCEIKGNLFIDNDGDGISLSYCLNFIVVNNVLIGNYGRTIGSGTGIKLYEGENCYARNNTIHESDFGIGWRGVNCTLESNMISDSFAEGLAIVNSNECKIKNNTISNCIEEGVRLSYVSNVILSNNIISDNIMDGIEFRDTVNCSAVNNAIFNNAEHGVAMLESSSGNRLRSNLLCGNSLIGIMFDDTSYNNTAYDNRFLWNGLTNALDNGTDNSWDDNVSLGNAWDDYDGTGSYPIQGWAESFDRYPGIADNSTPEIDSPSDLQYNEGTDGHSITWIISGAVPNMYQIYREQTEIKSSDWNNYIIDVDVDGLSLGVYNYTLVITDLLGNIASDTVFVTVIDGTAPILDSPDDVQFNEGTTGYTITWNPDDLHPESYTIEVNGVVASFGSWNSSEEDISFELDAFTIGTYNVTLLVTDIGGNTVIDTVIVTILPPTTTTTIVTTTTTTTEIITTTITDTTTSNTTIPPDLQDTMIVILLASGLGAVVIIIVLLSIKKKG